MKLKKIVAIMSCTVLGVAIGSCSTKETTSETKTQAIATSTQTQTQTQTKDTSINNSLKMGSDASYVVGYQVGSGIARQDFGLYDKQTVAGFADALNNEKPRVSESQIRRNMETLKDRMIKKQLDIAKLNKVKSDEFMSQIAKMDNAVEVNDGVYYQMIKQGDGKKPSADSTVTIAYKGTTPVIAYEDDKSKLNDVKEGKLIGPSFDSSENATFPLRNLIECWKDAIPKMPNGSTFILYCAPNKAYGTRAPATIGPNQALTFEITLKDFK
ncbi:FKBP-type peptidyl-prolyl cis-trans isomerase N-terminal domain-containing protein [Francisella salimarina]|uniref:Peptidyl-prolyl cis-trans isomerase n=1 Tax=Francisella salimarina TaxID=2599927 RepID=A0AAJ4NQ91_9GAMM|nr:FKBP-type peptidyl-prolyl cis-trans isomerase N-terminal domain-containing protein [Francisella salimarina]QWV00160.1 FKBP-type peptidyl-prolyl cis-trans isomerase [Francisella salimarina]